jgi:hypothetical protein
VPGLSVCAALAAGLCLPGLRRWRVGDPPRFVALRPLRSGNFGYGGNDFPRQQAALDGLVASHVAGDFPMEIFTKAFGPNHPHVAICRENYENLRREMRKVGTTNPERSRYK